MNLLYLVFLRKDKNNDFNIGFYIFGNKVFVLSETPLVLGFKKPIFTAGINAEKNIGIARQSLYDITLLIIMKRKLSFVLLFLSLFLLCDSVFGRVLIVNNHRPSPGEYFSLQTAIQFSSPWDTIMVKGSPVNYGNVVVDKPLIILGNADPLSGDNQYTSKLSRVMFTDNLQLRTKASGSLLKGFEFQHYQGDRPNITIRIRGKEPISEVRLKNNFIWYMQLGDNATEWEIINNIFGGWIDGGGRLNQPGSGSSASVFYNNIIGDVRGFQAPNTFENNVITGRLMRLKEQQFSRNIFKYQGYLFQDVANCDFVNNLAAADSLSADNCYLPVNNLVGQNTCMNLSNTGSGNRMGVKPGFVGVQQGEVPKGVGAFRLGSGSPARGAGRQGEDLGVFGGNHPMPEAPFNAMKTKELMEAWFLDKEMPEPDQ